MNSEVMLDLETLGRSARAAIASIGACKFEEGKILDEFYAKVDPEDCVAHGLEVESDTVDWWKKQDEEAQKEIFGGERLKLRDSLESFSSWFGDDKPVWGNGSDFDNLILGEAFKRVGMRVPWSFWNNRCYRTAMEILPDVTLVRNGTPHHALADAFYQARCLVEARKLDK